jgi:DNA-binding NarL/FixJ family response regulator
MKRFDEAAPRPMPRSGHLAAVPTKVGSRPVPAIRLILADDHPLFLDGVEHVLGQERGFVIVARCKTGGQALRAVAEHDPDILLLNVRLLGKDGMAVLRELAEEKEKRRTRVVLLTALLDDALTLEALRCGVRGIVPTDVSAASLVKCLRMVHAGGQCIENGSLGRAFDLLLKREKVTTQLNRILTPREVEVVKKAAAGLGNRAIAEALGVTTGTVKIHLHNVYEKLELNGRFSLMAWAREHEMV